MRVVVADEVVGTEQIAAVGGVLVAIGGVVRPDIVPRFAHRVEGGVAAPAVRTVGTAEVDSEKMRRRGESAVVVGGLEVGVGQNSAGASVGAENLDLDVLDGGVLHLEPHVEDVVGGSEGRARGELREGDDRAVVETVGRAAFTVGQEHGVVDLKRGRQRISHLLKHNMAVVVVANGRRKGLSRT